MIWTRGRFFLPTRVFLEVLSMDKRLEANMRFLCDESRMLTGITVAYGTTTYSEWAQ